MNGGTPSTLLAPPSLRWSSVRDCGRKAVYEATGAPHRDRTPKEERTLFRGKQVGHGFVIALANENRWKVHVASGPDFMAPYPHLRADNAETADATAELKIAWQLGTGHADLYVKETNTILEVLSSQHATPDMMHSKLVQAAGYAAGLDAKSIALAVVDPVTLDEDRIIVTESSRNWIDLMAEVDERVAQVRQWADSGRMPARVCGKPGDAFGHFCQYAAHCFDGWTPDPLKQLDDPDTMSLVAELFHAKGAEKEVKATLREIEARRKAVEEQLADKIDPGKWQAGGFQVINSARTRESFKLAVAREDSRFPDALLDEFTSVSKFNVWTVERAAVTADVDYGPVPF